MGQPGQGLAGGQINITILLMMLYLYSQCDVGFGSENITRTDNNSFISNSPERTRIKTTLVNNIEVVECVDCLNKNVTDDLPLEVSTESNAVINTTMTPNNATEGVVGVNTTGQDVFENSTQSHLQTELSDENFKLNMSKINFDATNNSVYSNESEDDISDRLINNSTSALHGISQNSTSDKSHHLNTILKHHKSIHKKNLKHHLTKQQYEYLVRHFTGFMPNVRMGKPTPDNLDGELELDDGPFGSILWRDKKYLVTVLIPIGVGITGAMLIIVMAYATRMCRRRKVAERNPRTLLQPSPSRPDDIMLLEQSSDDEF